MRLPPLLAALSLALLNTVAQAATAPPSTTPAAPAINAAGQALLDAAHALMAQGKNQQALAKLSEAAKADPGSSLPISSIASLIQSAAQQAQGERRTELRKQAEVVARQALRLHPDDPIAHEVLRTLSDEQPPPLHVAAADVAALVHQGETAFGQRKYDEALAYYERAAALDPAYSLPWVYAGDCFYAQKKFDEAEKRFRKAVEIEPLNAQAWRFLSDAQAGQGKEAAAQDALFNGIAAQPSQIPNWSKLARLRASAGYPLTPLALVRQASGKRNPATGKPTVEVSFEQPASEAATTTDQAFWLSLAMQQALFATQQDRQGGTGGDPQQASQPGPFAAELDAWRTALAVVAEHEQAGQGGLQTPALQTMAMLHKEGQLETALLLLQYREAWRTEFEAWKKDHPGAIRKFTDRYALRP